MAQLLNRIHAANRMLTVHKLYMLQCVVRHISNSETNRFWRLRNVAASVPHTNRKPLHTPFAFQSPCSMRVRLSISHTRIWFRQLRVALHNSNRKLLLNSTRSWAIEWCMNDCHTHILHAVWSATFDSYNTQILRAIAIRKLFSISDVEIDDISVYCTSFSAIDIHADSVRLINTLYVQTQPPVKWVHDLSPFGRLAVWTTLRRSDCVALLSVILKLVTNKIFYSC